MLKKDIKLYDLINNQSTEAVIKEIDTIISLLFPECQIFEKFHEVGDIY